MTELQCEPLLRLRDRREERERKRSPAVVPRSIGGGNPVGAYDFQEMIAALLNALPSVDDIRSDAQAEPILVRRALPVPALPTVATFAGAISDGSIQLGSEYVFGATSGQGRFVDIQPWRGQLPERVDAGLREMLTSGTVLILRCVRDLMPFSRDVADALARSALARVDINAYLSAAETCGFSVHNDDHDVLVVQCSGRRRWTLFGGGRLFPLRRDVVTDEVLADETVQLQVHLDPGDVLYVPRGAWHVVDQAEHAGGEPSVHLSYGLYRPNGLDMLEWLVARVVEQSIARSDVPLGSDAGTMVEYLAALGAEIHAAADAMTTLPVRCVTADILGALPLLGDAQQLAEGAALEGHLVSRCGHPVEVIAGEDGATFFAGGRRWDVDVRHAAACDRFLNSTNGSSIDAESLDEDELALARALVKEGLVRMTTDA